MQWQDSWGGLSPVTDGCQPVTGACLSYITGSHCATNLASTTTHPLHCCHCCSHCCFRYCRTSSLVQSVTAAATLRSVTGTTTTSHLMSLQHSNSNKALNLLLQLRMLQHPHLHLRM